MDNPPSFLLCFFMAVNQGWRSALFMSDPSCCGRCLTGDPRGCDMAWLWPWFDHTFLLCCMRRYNQDISWKTRLTVPYWIRGNCRVRMLKQGYSALKGIVHPKMKIMSLITRPHVKPVKHSEHKLRYFWRNPRAFLPCIDSSSTTTFNAQKGSKDIVKIVHVTSVVQP